MSNRVETEKCIRVIELIRVCVARSGGNPE